jgi:CPA2 family monovalent cation:H+ antiporter-2
VEDLRLVVDLVLALGAAFLGGMVAQRLGQPVLLGYILAGVLIGPNTPGLVADRERVELLANLGVALLMFALGVEFSFNELRRVRRVALLAGGLQIPLTVGLGTVVGLAIGWPPRAALLLGGAFAISSSIVALKLLLGRGEGDSAQARVALGLGIVQDLSLVPMLALVPLLTGETENLGLAVARSLGTAAVALVVVALVGSRLVPRVFYAVARTGSRELFLLAVVLIALGTALASHEAGLSFALGAFLAGLVVSESEFDSQVLAEVIPLRDIFATLFFVAVGMLLEPRFVVDHLPIVLGAIAALVLGKLLIAGGAFLAAGVDHRTATLAAILLAQMGEFSFVLAGVGLADGVIDGDQYGLVLAVALGSILLVPGLLAAAPRLVAIAERLPGVAAQERGQAGPEAAGETALAGHVVLCGYGRVGAELGSALERRGIPYAVIEINPAVVRELRGRGVPAFYGDAGAEALLSYAGIERATTLAIATPDLVTAHAAVRLARRMNPSIHVIARATARGEVGPLAEAGADEVVQPEFEAGLEFARQVLRWHDVGVDEVAAAIGRRRTAFYQPDDVPPRTPAAHDEGAPLTSAAPRPPAAR